MDIFGSPSSSLRGREPQIASGSRRNLGVRGDSAVKRLTALPKTFVWRGLRKHSLVWLVSDKIRLHAS